MGGNPFITGWMKGLLDQGQRVMRLYMQRFHDRVPATKLDQHRALIAAIEAGDADAAERAGMADAGNLIEEVTSFFSDLPTAELAVEPAARRRRKEG
jgi:DNA-binding GntR family transcriptional regulator